MVYIPKAIIFCSKVQCFGLMRSLLMELYAEVLKPSTIAIPSLISETLTKLINTYGYKQA